ncbi:MAG: (Fe-S)-binding protein [Bacillota bacterium]
MTEERKGFNHFYDIYSREKILPYLKHEAAAIPQWESCISCGLCLSRCPLLKGLDGCNYPGPAAVADRLSRSVTEYWSAADVIFHCTTCMACQEACPSGVPVMEAVLMIRAKIIEQARQAGKEISPFKERAFREILLKPGRLDKLARLGSLGQNLLLEGPVGSLLKHVLPPGMDCRPLFPPLAKKPLPKILPEVLKSPGARIRAGFFGGCLTNYSYTGLGQAVARVLSINGVEVVFPGDQQCCGAPLVTFGDRGGARLLAGQNIVSFKRPGCDVIVTACASCGLVLKLKYPTLFSESDEIYPDVLDFCGKVKDITEFLAEKADLKEPRAKMPLRVTCHDPCHLNRGQGISGQPRSILKAIPGLDLVEMAEPGTCCGGAGLFSLEHTDWSQKILSSKIRDIQSTGAGAVATSCPGCILQISGGVREAGAGQRVVHPVQLLAEAYE